MAGRPGYEPVAVLEEEEGEDQSQQGSSDHLKGEGSAGDDATRDRFRVCSHVVHDGPDVPVDLIWCEAEGTVDQPTLDVGDTTIKIVADLSELVTERWPDEQRGTDQKRGDTNEHAHGGKKR